ncbi:MAG: tyrosine-protein phosphatase [Polyangiales bacterium]
MLTHQQNQANACARERAREVQPEPAAAAEPSETRTVLAAHVENARELGGTALQESGKVASGLLFRGPPLAALGNDGCAAVAELGIRSVIDLRVESEVSLRPDDACVSSEAQLLAAPLPPYNVGSKP